MRTTLTLDDDVYAAARTLADTTGRNLGAVISDLARKGLRPTDARVRPGALPVFHVPPDAAIIPMDRADELIAEEGVER